MQLDEYISATIYSTLKALRDTNERLESEGLGTVWTGDIKTMSQDLVHVRLVKGTHPRISGESVPVILLDYEVHVAVSGETGSQNEIGAGASAKLLEVVSLGTKAKHSEEKGHREEEIHRLRFTVPVSMPVREERARPPRPDLRTMEERRPNDKRARNS